MSLRLPIVADMWHPLTLPKQNANHQPINSKSNSNSNSSNHNYYCNYFQQFDFEKTRTCLVYANEPMESRLAMQYFLTSTSWVRWRKMLITTVFSGWVLERE